MFSKLRFLGILSTILFLIAPVTAFADSPAPQYDYIEEVAGGKFIFVMLSISNDSSAYGQGGAEQDDKIRSQYTQSGLYKNDGSTQPLWTVEWYAFQVNISSDGEHLVKWGPWAWRDNYHELALLFYRNGQEIKRYHVDNLVADPTSLPHSVSHYMWAQDSSFDDEQGTLFLSTHTGEKYLFDIKSGEILEETSSKSEDILEEMSSKQNWFLYLVGILAIIMVLVILWYRK